MNKIKSILMLLLTVVLVVGSTVCTYADNTEKEEKKENKVTTFKTSEEAVQAHGHEIEGLSTTGGEGYNHYAYDAYDKTMYYWTDAEKDDIILKANEIEKKNAEHTTNKEDLESFHNITDGMALKADTKQAYGLLSGFTGVIRVLLGIIVVIVSVGMTVYSGFDLCYIAFPVFRNSCEAAKQGHGGGMMGNMAVKQGKNGENQLRFVSDDAQYAVTAAETVATGQNPFIIYFKKRFVSYLVLAVLLFILLTGRITVFTDIALKLTQGIIDAVQGI